MKTIIFTSIMAALVTMGTTVTAQDYPEEYLGLPGDNLNLYAVMKLFQESETLEKFERDLNDEKSRINNLDLNNDNLIDYITVNDFVNGSDHTIVLKVALGRNEWQDIAVFTVQKMQNGSVQIQLIGDETLYGKNYIIEPIYEETPNPGYTGERTQVTNINVYRVSPWDVADWPLIRYIYFPGYSIWRSSWYWGFYPDYWHPWTPYYWHYYYGYHYHWYDYYYGHYHHWDRCRYDRYHDFYYTGFRAHSPVVVVNITNNVYRKSYSRPEQRRDGEALYSRSHPDRPMRSAESRPSTGSRQSSVTSRESQAKSQRPESTGRQQTTGNRQTEVRSQRPATISRESEARSQKSETVSRQPAKSESRQPSGSYRQPENRSSKPETGKSEYRPSQNRNNQGSGISRSSGTQSARSSQGSGISKSSGTQSARSSQGSRSGSQGSRASAPSVQRSSSGKSSSGNSSSSSKSSGRSSNSDRRR
jgi:hypothetical protein